jgi:hypothetical protein
MTTLIWLQRLRFDRDPISHSSVSVVISEAREWAEMISEPGSREKGSGYGERLLGVATFRIYNRPGLDGINWRVKDSDNQLWDIVDIPRPTKDRMFLDLHCQMTGQKQESGAVDVVSLLLGGASGTD